MIIGLVGLPASGKDTVADYLSRKNGFRHLSLSAVLREEARKHNIDINLENLTQFGIDLKKERGGNILAILARDQVKGDTIISSIRMPEEVEYLKQIPNFVLVNVDGGSIEKRYGRFIERDREDDKSLDFAKFKKIETEQRKGNGGQSIDAVIKLAKETIDNTKDFRYLYKQIDSLIKKLEKSKSVYIRPSWDEYFLHLTEIIGERGTCDRGRSGAVITKDHRLITTGYVGPPAGMSHCDEVGHQLKKTVHEDGQITTHCVRTIHAEQNAILQGAKYGISLQKGTIYCRMEPCIVCARMIINAGIVRVVALNKYHVATETREAFKECGVELDIINDKFEEYKNQ